jgi:hypothetical protein
VSRGIARTFARCLLTVAGRADACRSVEVARCVIPRRRLSVALLGLSVAHVGSPIAVPAFQVTLTSLREGVLVFIRCAGVQVRERHVGALASARRQNNCCKCGDISAGKSVAHREGGVEKSNEDRVWGAGLGSELRLVEGADEKRVIDPLDGADLAGGVGGRHPHPSAFTERPFSDT